MTRLPLSLPAKEFRALFTTWSVCMVTVAATAALGITASAAVGLFVCALGSIALGTQLFGREFGNRTLGGLLSQPVARGSVLLIKMGVLVALVVSLGALSMALLPATPTDPPGSWAFWVALLFTLCGLFVAPCLTLLTRSGTAGLVFSIAVAGAIAVGCELVAIACQGSAPPEQLDAVRNVGLVGAMLVTSVLGALGTWWVFTRMDVLEGHDRAVRLAPWRGSSTESSAIVGAARRSHPIAQLVRKELHLQQMSFVVALLFVLSCGGLLLFQYLDSRLRPEFFESGTTLYLVLLGMVSGSIPCAEERSLGTLQSQRLLPVSTRIQWMVKAGVAVTLVITLGAVLPGLMLWGSGSATWWARVWPLAVPVLVLVTSLSLFVSALCSNGVRALLMAIPTAVAAMLALLWLDGTIYTMMDWWARPRGLINFASVISCRPPGLSLLAAAVISAILLHYGAVNQRSVHPSLAQLPRQLGWTIGLVVLLFVVLELATAQWFPRPPGL